jgi:hypothetical protein
LVLLGTTADPDDARLPELVRTVTCAFHNLDKLPWCLHDEAARLLTGAYAQTWERLINDILLPRRPVSPDIDRLLAALPQPPASPRRR